MKKNEVISFLFSEQNLSDSENINLVQLMRADTYFHGFYGKFEITPETFRSMKENFDKKIRKVELAVDYFHDSHGVAAGWIKDVVLQNNDTELWIDVEWTPEGQRRIKDKELRYLSADFTMNYTDIDEKGEEDFQAYGATLFGAGLTNRPFIKGMKKILSEKGEGKKTLKDMLILQGYQLSDVFDTIVEALPDLSEDEKGQIVQMLGGKIPAELEESKKVKESKMSEESKTLSELQSTVQKLSENVSVLEKERDDLMALNQKLEREQKFTALLAEGKVVPAQKEPFMEGDMAKFAEVSAKNAIHLNEDGSEGGSEDEEEKSDQPKTREEAEDAVTKLAEAKIKADSSVSYGDAVSGVLKDHPELAKLCEGGK